MARGDRGEIALGRARNEGKLQRRRRRRRRGMIMTMGARRRTNKQTKREAEHKIGQTGGGRGGLRSSVQ
eukprot:1034710-Pyramimonas_sp.AAC.1